MEIEIVEEREQLMANLNNDLSKVMNKHMTLLKPHEIYLVMVKLTDDIFRIWRKSLKEE